MGERPYCNMEGGETEDETDEGDQRRRAIWREVGRGGMGDELRLAWHLIPPFPFSPQSLQQSTTTTTIIIIAHHSPYRSCVIIYRAHLHHISITFTRADIPTITT